MKKIISVLLGVGMLAGTASAEWWVFRKDRKGKEPSVEQNLCPKCAAKEQAVKQKTDEQKRVRKEQREELRRLADTARAETDPVKREMLVGELRAKLVEGQVRVQESFRKRLKKAEAGVGKLKSRLEAAESNQDKRIEKKLAQLLSGERPQHEKDGKKVRAGEGLIREKPE
jgi:hypothetical protein